MVNAESVLTAEVRKALEGRGALCIKLSDRFTRGVPDMLVTSDRVVAIEFKVLDAEVTPTVGWKQLGLSGAQDHNLRQIARRARRAACVITGPSRNGAADIRLWVPVSPENETNDGLYRLAARGEDATLKWVLG